MNEKVHYEIKFVETDEGFRLEASGDKDALRRLGIGPNMVGRKQKRGAHERRRRHSALARRRHRMKRAPYFATRGKRGFGPRRRPLPIAHHVDRSDCHPWMAAPEAPHDPRSSWEE
jgi:hypothetical protein